MPIAVVAGGRRMGFSDWDAIFFHGMKRSGNHAVIDWIADNVGSVRHFNNVFPIAKILEKPGLFEFPIPFRKFVKSRQEWHEFFARKPKVSLLSIEDHRFSRDFFEDAGRTSNILLLRSAENVFSSRIRKGFEVDMPAYPREMNLVMRRAMDIWANHVESLIANFDRSDFVAIFFDLWITNVAYREWVAAQLGFNSVIPPRMSRAKAGGGSSFDGHASISASSATSLLCRRNQLADRQRAVLDKVLSDPSIVQSEQKLAKFIDAKEHFWSHQSRTIDGQLKNEQIEIGGRR